MRVPTWEGGLHPLRPESPHCPGGSAPPTPPMARPGGGGAVALRLAGGVPSDLQLLPWNGVTLADIVMPWFLFMVGASMSMSLRKYLRGGRARIAGTY